MLFLCGCVILCQTIQLFVIELEILTLHAMCEMVIISLSTSFILFLCGYVILCQTIQLFVIELEIIKLNSMCEMVTKYPFQSHSYCSCLRASHILFRRTISFLKDLKNPCKDAMPFVCGEVMPPTRQFQQFLRALLPIDRCNMSNGYMTCH